MLRPITVGQRAPSMLYLSNGVDQVSGYWTV
ncbi:hypothetical protein J2Z48_003095 [Croceifilum oryzae]|uniref:Uncharacterized protein n=1 Tax=Croceifilum oryzae TaxID=1553429 RepID=A0AAJ1TQ16_9BACL|nr:hypothetical protein [Croceifilum oryzae]